MKAYQHALIWATIIALLTGLFLYTGRKKQCDNFTHAQSQPAQTVPTANIPVPFKGPYIIQQFNLHKKLSWLTESQLDQHKTLYEGYVNKRNEITEKLTTIDRSEKGNRTYSPYRALKIAETFAVNGSLLHELYFENIGGAQQAIGPQMEKLIIDNYGSVENFKQDFILAALCAQGWVITSFGLDDKRLHNFVLESHNQNVPILAIPLLVLDVYEHAYMIDFGINRNPYVEQFWKTIDWNVIEERIQTWIQPFLKS